MKGYMEAEKVLFSLQCQVTDCDWAFRKLWRTTQYVKKQQEVEADAYFADCQGEEA
jgi:hypothetical protein